MITSTSVGFGERPELVDLFYGIDGFCWDEIVLLDFRPVQSSSVDQLRGEDHLWFLLDRLLPSVASLGRILDQRAD